VGATIRDVAREAGVSVATVSRFFNDSGPVRHETRLRIDEVARRLRYVPNRAAQSLSTRRTRTIGVLLPDLHGEFFSEVIRGIDQTVRRTGWHMLLSSSHDDRAEIEAALRAMRGRVDGLIVMSPDVDAEALSGNLPEHLPVVLMSCELEHRSYASLDIDNHGGARALVRHLLDVGHRRIGVIAGPARNHDARERLRGMRAELAAAGVAHDASLEVAGDFSESAGYAGARQLMAHTSPPSVIFACNDAMAVGALCALRDADVRVPEDVAVVGFDDIPIARYVSPPLTTVRVAIARLGERAAERLFQAIDASGGHDATHEVMPTELVVRRSSGGAAGGAEEFNGSTHP
jgi:LacI family transcriptional regulator